MLSVYSLYVERTSLSLLAAVDTQGQFVLLRLHFARGIGILSEKNMSMGMLSRILT